MSTTLPQEITRVLPVFKVWADDGKHPSVALNRPVCVIGRREIGVNLPLQAPEVSKLHALVVRTQRQVYLRDLASRNGVQRNGEPVQEAPLSDHDVLRIGAYTLRCASGFGHHNNGHDTGGNGQALPAALPPAELIAADGQAYPLAAGQHTLLIGQRQGCDVRLPGDDNVAPVHAIVFEMDGKRFVRDLEAPAGTYLNDRSIHQSEIKPGDRIRIGPVTLRYELADVTAMEADEDAASAQDALRVDDSAPGIDLVDSAVATSSLSDATGDSLILPEITMEDSRIAPAPPAPRPASPISEYDFDVMDDDPRRESTFAGEVVAEDGREAGESVVAAAPEDARPARPEVPPVVATTFQPGLSDSSIPIAGSFHDQLVDDHPPAETNVAADVAAKSSVDAKDEAAKEKISNLVEEVVERVEEVSETVEEVAETAETLQAAWSEFKGEKPAREPSKRTPKRTRSAKKRNKPATE